MSKESLVLGWGQADAVLHGPGILAPDILGCQLNVEHGGADLRMSHQLLKGGQGDAGANHIGPKCVPEPMWIGLWDPTARAMMPEQRAEPCQGHGLSAMAAFQGDEQGG